MPQPFNCPSCQAPLVPPQGQATVRCDYCGNSAIVPEALRPKASPSPVVVTLPTSGSPPRQSSGAGCLVTLLVLLVTLLLVGGVVVGVAGGPAAVGALVRQGEPIATEGAINVPFVPQPTSAPDFFQLLSQFGGEGTGQGRLDDARSIGVDGAGTLYVADYASGRIQRFNGAGEYQGQWMVVNETNPVTQMAVARDGTVLVNQGFDVHRYEGASGAHLGTLSYPSDSTLVLDGAIPLPDGGLLINERGETLVWLDGAGGVVRRVGAPGREHGSRLGPMAVDGQGGVFVLGRLGERGSTNDGIFRFDAGGDYLGFFGGSGDEPGQLRAPNAVAVDGRGRVLVSDIHGVHLFDSRGRFLRTLDVEGVIFGMALDSEGDLWVTNREQLSELRLADEP